MPPRTDGWALCSIPPRKFLPPGLADWMRLCFLQGPRPFMSTVKLEKPWLGHFSPVDPGTSREAKPGNGGALGGVGRGGC